MEQSHFGSWRVGAAVVPMVAIAAMAVGGLAGPIVVSAEPAAVAPQTSEQLGARAASGQWDTFSARVTIHRERLDDGGGRVGTALDEAFVWQRVRSGSSWKSTITVISQSRPAVQSRAGVVTLADVGAVERIEDAGDGSAPRFFNRSGVEIVLPSDAVHRRLGFTAAPGVDPAAVEGALSGRRFVQPAQGRDWIESMVMSAAGRARRLQSFSRTLGRRAGLVGGLGRYLRDEGAGQGEVLREVLIDEQRAVPVEMNLTRNRSLVSHTRFSYEESPSGAMVRRGVRTEREAAGQHLVSEIGYDGIRLDQKGGR